MRCRWKNYIMQGISTGNNQQLNIYEYEKIYVYRIDVTRLWRCDGADS